MILLINVAQPILAFFPKSHSAWTIDGFNDVNSEITNRCRPYLYDILDMNSGSDSGVIYYGSSDQKALGTYISTHTSSSGYDTCKLNAKDERQRCKCLGVGLHIIIDSNSHLEGGVVEKYLKKYKASNYFGHMAIERFYETKHLKLLKDRGDYSITSGIGADYDSKFMDTFFKEDSAGALVPTEDMQLLNSMAGVDMSNTVQIFKAGYKGEGFYSAVYKDKISLPFWMESIALGLLFIGLAMAIFVLLVGTTKWKYFTAIQWFLIFLFGGLIWYSFNPTFFGLIKDGIWSITKMPLPSWKIITFIIEVPPLLVGWQVFAIFLVLSLIPVFFIKGGYAKWVISIILFSFGAYAWFVLGGGGYLSVTADDVKFYDQKIQSEVNKFLMDEQLNIVDASGLSYTDPSGNEVVGALTQAEKGFKLINYFILIPLFLIFQLWLIFKSLGIKFRKSL